MAEDASTPAIFQFFQNIFSFRENNGYMLILLDFPFSRNPACDFSEKLFHCAFGEIGRE
ncbi:IclR family transcriptional regulator, partial [Mesorhizobium sp. M7A.F.Ca.CA.002.11.2.1]